MFAIKDNNRMVFSNQQKSAMQMISLWVHQHPGDVADALRSEGVELSANPSSVELVERLMQTASSQPRFQKAIASRIANAYGATNISGCCGNYSRNNGDPNFIGPPEFDWTSLGGNGETAGSAASNVLGGAAGGGAVGAIAGAVNSIFGFLSIGGQKDIAQQQANAQILSGIAMLEAERAKKKRTELMIGGAILITAIIGTVVIIKITSGKKAAA